MHSGPGVRVHVQCCAHCAVLHSRINDLIDQIRRASAVDAVDARRAEEILFGLDVLPPRLAVPPSMRWVMQVHPALEWFAALSSEEKKWYEHEDRADSLRRAYPSVSDFEWSVLVGGKDA